jgi:hypothetical protein
MKTIFLASVALIALSSTAMAQNRHHGHGGHGSNHHNTNVNANPTAIGIGQASAGASSGSQAVSQSGVTINNPANIVSQGFNRVRQSGSLRTTANAFAPQLTSSAVGTCLGSTSFGIGLTGFGFSGGTTHPDMACNLRLYSQALLAVGAKAAAAAVLCYDPYVYNAYAGVGIPCPVMPNGYRPVAAPIVAPRATYIPANGQVIQVNSEYNDRASYELQEARAAATRLQAVYRLND